MRRTLFRGIVAAAALAALPLVTSAVLAGQQPAGARTPGGESDLEGIWSYATITPLERPERYVLEGARFQEKEAAELAARGTGR